MRRTIFAFLAGMTCTALVLNAISVYVFHDVDKDMVGKWNEAYFELCVEFVVFTMVVGLGVWLLTVLGRRPFRLQKAAPRPKRGFFLGVAVIVFQYPVDFATEPSFQTTREFHLSYTLF